MNIRTQDKAYIYLQDVYFYYRENTRNNRAGLKGITSEVYPGDFLAVVGANGSGKTTLARHLNAMLVPSEGKVWIAGMDSSDEENVWEIRRCVGMVFQNPDNQAVAATVEEDVAFGPENLGIEPGEVRRRVESSLELAGLRHLNSRPPYTLSGGQKQLLAIAGVLAMEPGCIVLDEPTSMLDPRSRKHVIDVLVKLNKEKGITIILVTHFMEEAVLANRLWVMDKGKITLEGNVYDVFSKEDVLKNAGLEVPPARQLISRLKSMGLFISGENVITLEELLLCITKALNSTK